MKARDDAAGKSVRCPICSAVLAVPDPADVANIVAAVRGADGPDPVAVAPPLPPAKFLDVARHAETGAPMSRDELANPPPWFHTALTLYANVMMGVAVAQLAGFVMWAMTPPSPEQRREGTVAPFPLGTLAASASAFVALFLGAALIHLIVDASRKLRQIAARP
jgi:hypothetical protein